jgi:hypothetical protein
MNKSLYLSTTIVLSAFAMATTSFPAVAAEQRTPFQPGVTTGSPVGATPPPGLYFNNDTYFSSGEVVGGRGDDIGVKIQGAQVAPLLLWVPKLSLFGAQYSATFIQPYLLNNVDAAGAGGPNTISGGLFNTIISPESLSWSLGAGRFVSESVAIYLPDGTYKHTGTTTDASAVANDFLTVEPSAAFSYLNHGWDITANNVVDLDTKNKVTDYQSGDVYYLDWTVAHSFGHLSAGLVGNYTQQFTNDLHFGNVVGSRAAGTYGNRYMLASVGPMVSYDFGRVTLMFRYLQAVKAENGGKVSFAHLTLAFPISIF